LISFNKKFYKDESKKSLHEQYIRVFNENCLSFKWKNYITTDFIIFDILNEIDHIVYSITIKIAQKEGRLA
jgi:hypothetical protein